MPRHIGLSLQCKLWLKNSLFITGQMRINIFGRRFIKHTWTRDSDTIFELCKLTCTNKCLSQICDFCYLIEFNSCSPRPKLISARHHCRVAKKRNCSRTRIFLYIRMFVHSWSRTFRSVFFWLFAMSLTFMNYIFYNTRTILICATLNDEMEVRVAKQLSCSVTSAVIRRTHFVRVSPKWTLKFAA